MEKVLIAKRGLYRHQDNLILSLYTMTEDTITSDHPAVDLDIHRLDLRFEQTRISRPKPLARLVQSIAQDGLYLPIQVADTGGALVVIDGYQRLNAFRALGRDRIPAHCYPQPLEQALCEWFANQRSRKLDPIEEAWLIQQLLDEGQSRQAIVKHLGKGESWVSRRLALLDGLDGPYQQALREGVLHSWAASRIFIPLARANAADAKQLLKALHSAPFSTRELALWYRHYQSSRGETRQRLIAHPRLFLDTLNSQQQQKTLACSGVLGPLPKWLHELEGIVRHLSSLDKRLTDHPEPPPDLQTHTRMESQAESAKQHIERIIYTIAHVI